MSFIDLGMNLGDVKEKRAVPAGRHRLVVVNVKTGPAKSGKPMVTILHEIEGNAEAAPVTMYLSLPHPDDTPEARAFKGLQIARYLKQFKVPSESNGFNEEDIYGCSADVMLTLDEPTAEYPEPKNDMQLDRLATEAEEPARKAAAGGRKR